MPWSELDRQRSAAADIVITATGAVEPVLTRAGVHDVMRPRRQRPLFIIDIAMPRDVEASVGDLEQVFLYNIDDLQGIVKENLTRRSSELERAEAIVDEEVERFIGLAAVARDHPDRQWRCAIASRRSARPSWRGSSRSSRACRPMRARGSRRSPSC